MALSGIAQKLTGKSLAAYQVPQQLRESRNAALFAEFDVFRRYTKRVCKPCPRRRLISERVYEPMLKRPRPPHSGHRAKRLNRNRETRSTNPRPSQSGQIVPALEMGTARPPLPLQLGQLPHPSR